VIIWFPEPGRDGIVIIAMTSRRLLLTWAAACAGGCLPRPRPQSRPPKSGASAPSVLVIGAGLAGLAIAHALVQRGHDVKLLEAGERPGGRILTLRSPWRDGLFVEAGATHVVGDPDLLALCAEMNVALEKRASTRGLDRVALLGGRRIVVSRGETPPRQHPLGTEDEALGEQGRMDKYFAAATTFDPRAGPPPTVVPLDAISGAEHLRRQGASPGFIADIDAMLGLGDAGLEGMSALALVQSWAEIRREIGLGPSLRIAGGSDRLSGAIAARLGDRVIQGAAVTHIQQGATGVQVGFRRRGADATLVADRAVIAIPPTVLRDLTVRPALPDDKSRALRTIALESVTRMWVQTDRRFWTARGQSGRVDTDLPLGPVRDESDGLPGEAGILGLYTTRVEAKRLAALSDGERMRAALAYLEAAHPGAGAHFLAGASKCWDTDPFQRGAYAYFQPGQAVAYGALLGRVEGCLHFAGDHTSHRPGFMHGALASARRVVAEIAPTRQRD
jgi:monoamine oxidase